MSKKASRVGTLRIMSSCSRRYIEDRVSATLSHARFFESERIRMTVGTWTPGASLRGVLERLDHMQKRPSKREKKIALIVRYEPGGPVLEMICSD